MLALIVDSRHLDWDVTGKLHGDGTHIITFTVFSLSVALARTHQNT